jgi:transposase InsO family protein
MAVNTYQLCSSSLLDKRSYDMLMKTYQEGLKYQENREVVDFRLRIIEHLNKFGLTSTMNAFSGVGKSTIYGWKKTYEKSGKRRESLIPKSTQPHQFRTSKINWQLIEAIKLLRSKQLTGSHYARFLDISERELAVIPYDLGEKKIKVFLDKIALGLHLPSISHASIGRVIKNKQLVFAPVKKRNCSPVKRKDIKRIKKAPHPGKPGYIQADCILHYVGNRQIKCVNFIDVFGKVAYAKRIVNINSQETLTAFLEFRHICRTVYGFDIFALQHDNGAEFFGSLLAYLSHPPDPEHDQGIANHFILPRCPQIDGTIESFNNILQVEFINQCEVIYQDNWLPLFVKSMVDYLSYYNNHRPHGSLNNMSPKNYIKKFYSEM